jgi:hypothetical protein
LAAASANGLNRDEYDSSCNNLAKLGGRIEGGAKGLTLLCYYFITDISGYVRQSELPHKLDMLAARAFPVKRFTSLSRDLRDFALAASETVSITPQLACLSIPMPARLDHFLLSADSRSTSSIISSAGAVGGPPNILITFSINAVYSRCWNLRS